MSAQNVADSSAAAQTRGTVELLVRAEEIHPMLHTEAKVVHPDGRPSEWRQLDEVRVGSSVTETRSVLGVRSTTTRSGAVIIRFADGGHWKVDRNDHVLVRRRPR